MVELIESLDHQLVKQRVADAVAQIEHARSSSNRSANQVELLVASKYLAVDLISELAGTGISLIGENRADTLAVKSKAAQELGLQVDFIGHIQSRKTKEILPYVDRIHSVCSQSTIKQLQRFTELAKPNLELLLEVNIANDQAKFGIRPDQIDEYISISPFPVVGLMTMPPATDDPESSRRWFAKLAQLAGQHNLQHISMGTSQDFLIAVQEGATIVRLGSSILR